MLPLATRTVPVRTTVRVEVDAPTVADESVRRAWDEVGNATRPTLLFVPEPYRPPHDHGDDGGQYAPADHTDDNPPPGVHGYM